MSPSPLLKRLHCWVAAPWIRRAFPPLFLVLLAGLGFVTWSRSWVERQAAGRVYTRAADIPERPVAIVFGALVYPDGQLSSILEERVRAGIELYKAGKVQKLLMTGDNSRRGYDEVSAMKAYAAAHGVPQQDVVRDFAGFRTLDSCARARRVFDVDRAILVTQAYHLPRALFLARRFGIDAVGFAARSGAPPHMIHKYEGREWLADAEAILDLYALHRQPRFSGPREPLFARADKER